jgi:hypothetical protein
MTPHLRIKVEVEDRLEKKSETSKPHLKKPSMIGHHLLGRLNQTQTYPVRA